MLADGTGVQTRTLAGSPQAGLEGLKRTNLLKLTDLPTFLRLFGPLEYQRRPNTITLRTCYLQFDQRVRGQFGRPQSAVLDCKIGALGAPKLVSTQTPIETKRPTDPAGHQKIHRVEVYWTAVTYKTVAMYVLLAAAILFSALYIASPNWYSTTVRKISTAIDTSDNENIAINQTQAKFVNLDG